MKPLDCLRLLGSRHEDISSKIQKIFVEVWKLLIATLPTQEAARVLGDLKGIYPVVAGENVLASSLNNLNPIVHPGRLCSQCRLDRHPGKRFSLLPPWHYAVYSAGD